MTATANPPHFSAKNNIFCFDIAQASSWVNMILHMIIMIYPPDVIVHLFYTIVKKVALYILIILMLMHIIILYVGSNAVLLQLWYFEYKHYYARA